MGDSVRCHVTGENWYPTLVRPCYHPLIIKKYGYAGKCNVCIYVCRKCQFRQEDKYSGLLRCSYELGK